MYSPVFSFMCFYSFLKECLSTRVRWPFSVANDKHINTNCFDSSSPTNMSTIISSQGIIYAAEVNQLNNGKKVQTLQLSSISELHFSYILSLFLFQFVIQNRISPRFLYLRSPHVDDILSIIVTIPIITPMPHFS